MDYTRIKCTSINHCKNSNYQIDQMGTKHDCTARFEDWCLKNDVIWGHLFDERTGQMIATFDNVQGLNTKQPKITEGYEMLLKTHFHRRSDYCAHCGNPKRVQIAHFENGEAVMRKQCETHEYRVLHQHETVEAVWCSGCGAMYHPDSI